MLELETLRQKLRRQRSASSHVAKVPVGQLDSGRPVPTTIHKRRRRRGERLPAQVQPAQQRPRTGKGVAHVPVFIAHVQIELVSPRRIFGEWTGEGCAETSLLGVPPDQRFKVNGSTPNVEKLRMDGLKRETAKK